MIDDFSKYFTIEIYGEKGWEVVWSCFDWDDAISHVNIYSLEYQVRITSPIKEKESKKEIK